MEIFLSAGDLSGDNASARLIGSLRHYDPSLSLFGLGRGKLRKLGQDQLADGNDLAVLGFWEVAKRYSFFRRLMHRCVHEITRRKPDAVVLVDYPGFNLRLAKRIRSLGIPIIYYISPQVWAWGNKRVRALEELVDLMLVILPFEADFFAKTSVNAHFVGHYLLEDIPTDYINSDPPDVKSGGLALLPGSRPQEIQRILPPMLEAADRFVRQHDTRAVIAGVAEAFDYEAALKKNSSERLSVVYDDSRRVIHDSAVVVTASGTATLETGIIGRPMVVVYRTGAITYQIAKRLITLDKIALVNLVAGKEVAPELIQYDVTPNRLTEQLERFWRDPAYYKSTVKQLNRVPELLGGIGASDRAARMIVDHVGRN